jgi:glycosyltransferase involved in cell wall biosynthesis
MSEFTSIAVIVPVFNEEQRIQSVLEELHAQFDEVLSEVIVIDDCSTDETSRILHTMQKVYPKSKVLRNSLNLGHGPSVIKGLETALQGSSSHFLTYDGDGYLNCVDIISGIRNTNFTKEDVVIEMVRFGRTDPAYRKFITNFLRLIVRLLTFKKVSDPNTPSRVISRNTLQIFLLVTSKNNPVPSLWFGIFARKRGIKIKELKVRVEIEPSIDIRNSWDSKLHFIPSRRFIKFCLTAGKFWTWKR